MTDAHAQRQTIHLAVWYPDHAPRERDAHYHLFEAARQRLAAAGKLVCWRCGATERIELHHTLVEYALQNGVDLARFVAHFPEFGPMDEETFFRWVERDEHNLTPLCVPCHRGDQGIHVLPHPAWLAGAYWKSDLPPPAVVEQGGTDAR